MSITPNISRWLKLATAIACVLVSATCYPKTSIGDVFLLIVAGMWAEDFRTSGGNDHG